MKKIFILISLLLSQVTYSQQIIDLNINEIRGNDTTQGGCSDYNGIYVRTTGVVYGQNFRQSANGLQISLVEKRADTLLSNRCGIGLFKGTMDLPVTINEGDSIVAVGLVNCFNGLSQITVDTIRILKTGCQLTQPRVVIDLNEVSESYLVKLLNVEFMPNFWPASPSPTGFTARVFMGTPGTTDYKEIDVRIDNDCDLYGQNMPQGKVDIIGIGGQFDTSPPIDSKYQLLPRKSADVSTAAPLVLPEFSFQDTIFTLTEGSVYVIPVNSTQPVTSQLSCLVVSENITAGDQDYSIQQPPVVTFTLGSNSSQFGFTLNTDSVNETDEQFFLKLRKISDGYKIGQDSVARVIIVGTTSVRPTRYFDFYKNSFNGTLSVNLPNDFVGEVDVYNSLGRKILSSKNNMINDDMNSLSYQPPGIYRAIFTTDNKIFVRNFIN
jgi:hypothetical protein